MEDKRLDPEKRIDQFKKNNPLEKENPFKAKYPGLDMEIIEFGDRYDVLSTSTPVGGGDDDDE